MKNSSYFNIKRICGIALLVTGVLVSSCKKFDEFTHFDYASDYVVKVEASPILPAPINIITPEIATTSESEFGANKTRKDMVEQVVLRQLELTVKAPVSGDLRFLKSVNVFLSAGELPEIRVAYKDDVPDDIGATLNLDVTGANLREYIQEDTYRLRVTVITDDEISEDHYINAHGVFFVDAKVLGQ
jgi:hypothetical protein